MSGFGRRKVVAGLLASAATGQLLKMPGAMAATNPEYGVVRLESFRMSPDGETVLFQYYDTRFLAADNIENVKAGAKLAGLGLLEWRTGKLTRIPNPPGKELRSASWSYDGKRLVTAMTGRGALSTPEIVLVDVPGFTVTPLIGLSDVKGWVKGDPLSLLNPVFQPGTGNVLYSVWLWGGVPHHLHLFNPADRSDTVVLGEEDGFRVGLYVPSFIGADEIVFEASGAVNPQVREIVKELTGSPSQELTYKLKFGDSPEVLFPELHRRKLPFEPHIINVSAAKDGKQIVAISRNLSEPTNARGKHVYELFEVNGGSLKPLTNLRTYLMGSGIAYGGSAVAFGIDPEWIRRIDLAVLDMKTGATVQTGLLGRIERELDFFLTLR